MYLSQLRLNPRNRNVRRDLASPYELHRTLLRAFPDQKDGAAGRVLFRVEPNPEGHQCVVLVQSYEKPDWSNLSDTDYAEISGPKFVRFVPEQSAVVAGDNGILVRTGDRFRFRLLANPTVKREGKRHGIHREDDLVAWMQRKAIDGGFCVERHDLVVVPVGRIQSGKKCPTNGDSMTLSHHAVRFEGVLKVAHPHQFIATLELGIGSAKGFGFGLLSLARI